MRIHPRSGRETRGVELAIASEPLGPRPQIWGRRPAGVDPSHPSGADR